MTAPLLTLREQVGADGPNRDPGFSLTPGAVSLPRLFPPLSRTGLSGAPVETLANTFDFAPRPLSSQCETMRPRVAQHDASNASVAFRSGAS